MLPLHAPTKKMNRHGYSGSFDSNHGGAHREKTPTSPAPYMRSTSMGESGSFNISTDKWDDKYRPRSGRIHSRRGTLTRFGALLTGILLILMYFFPSFRPTGVTSFLFPPGEEFNIETVRYYDLSNVGGTSRGWEREERILLCAPLRDAAPHLPMFFSHLKNLTYPHNLIDLAFLVGDSKDNTADLLSDLLAELQSAPSPKDWFGEISVLEKDFGQVIAQDVESRHGFAAQAGRRKSMAQARNWLLSAALRPTHSWVYWRDVDVETAPFTILEDLMRHNKDVIVPNVWRPLPEWLGGEQPYDLNSWQESETALALAETLDEDAVIVEGYAEYATWRPHLAYLRDPYGDPDMEMEIDGVGGVSILAKARVFRSGVHFPAFSFEKHAETEGFGKMAKRMQFSVVGLPHYTIWHLYEPSFEDIRHMEEMEKERRRREEEERRRKEELDKISQTFDVDAKQQFEKDKEAMREASRQGEKQAQQEQQKQQEAREQIKAGIKDSAAGFKKDEQGRMHLADPLGEARQLGGGGGGGGGGAAQAAKDAASSKERMEADREAILKAKKVEAGIALAHQVQAAAAAGEAARVANVEAADAKAAEEKAVEAKAAEVLAAEAKAAEQKAAADLKAAEHKAAEHKAADLRVAEVKAAEAKAAEHKAADLRVAEAKAAELQAAEHKAAEQRAAELRAAAAPVAPPKADDEDVEHDPRKLEA